MSTQDCPFCGIASGPERDQVVYLDDTVAAFMDLFPAAAGHLLVAPRRHCAGLGDLDEETGASMWRVAHRLARAARASGLPCEGVNLLLCDGVAAGQSVFHVHLHVIPRCAGDGIIFRAGHGRGRPEAGELGRNASSFRAALAQLAGLSLP